MIVISFIFYLFVGFIAGFFGGLLGIGGGLIVVPALAFYFKHQGFPENSLMQVAIGTSLAAMVFTAASSAWSHYRSQGVNWTYFRALTPGMIVGSILGAVFADYLPSGALQLIFGFSIFWVGIYFILPSKMTDFTLNFNPNFLVLCLLGVIIGGLSAILGIGGGLMTVPLLTLLSVPLRNAISTSAVTGFFIAVAGAAAFAHFGYFYLPAFIGISIASVFAAPFGAKCTYSLPVPYLKGIFGSCLIIIGVYLFMQ